MSKKCLSQFSNFIVWIRKSPFINISIFVIGMMAFWELLSQQYAYHLFIPIGKYAVYLEYIMLSVVIYFIYWAYKKRNIAPDECNMLMSFLNKTPFLKFFVDSMFALMIGYAFYYMFLLYIHKYDIPFQNKKYEVQVLDFSTGNRRNCKPSMKTNILNLYKPEQITFFYKAVKNYSFDNLCLYGKDFREGQTIIVQTRETLFGMYIYDVNAKAY